MTERDGEAARERQTERDRQTEAVRQKRERQRETERETDWLTDWTLLRDDKGVGTNAFRGNMSLIQLQHNQVVQQNFVIIIKHSNINLELK